MTYIEFFDKTVVENICACLVNPPERVILIGDKMKLLEKHVERYKSILNNRGAAVEFECKTVNKNNVQSIIETFSRIVETYEDCVFDLTGGEDLYLVAIGIISERYKDKNIQMHRFNIKNGTIIDGDSDGKTIALNKTPAMTVEENIKMYGGDVVKSSVKINGTFTWTLDESFKKDISLMWDICKRDVRLWNTQIGVFEAAELYRSESGDEMLTEAPVSHISDHLGRCGAKFIFIKGLVDRLYQCGLISEYYCDDRIFRIVYKNEQVKRCLTKSGQALEMKIFLTATEITDNDGNPVYNDVMNGVCIDWDGKIHTEKGEHDTENEIDVMMMREIIPVFVSCKNGYIDIDELYKLSSVAERFGGKYAKKVLVATALKYSGDFAEYFRQRAKDMNIRLVEGVQDMSDAELSKEIKSFWSN